jgi:voltage-dependent anion channel protein 2
MFVSLSTNKLEKYNIGLLYKVSPLVTLASQTTHTSAKTCDWVIGGSYKADGVGTIKAKVVAGGTVHACIIRDIMPKVTLTASGSISGGDMSTFKPGLGISM